MGKWYRLGKSECTADSPKRASPRKQADQTNLYKKYTGTGGPRIVDPHHRSPTKIMRALVDYGLERLNQGGKRPRDSRGRLLPDKPLAKVARTISADTEHLRRQLKNAYDKLQKGTGSEHSAPLPGGRKSGSGSEKKLKPEHLQMIAEKAKEWKGNFSVADMHTYLMDEFDAKSPGFTVCKATVAKTMKELGFQKQRVKTQIRLTANNKVRRKDWAIQLLNKLRDGNGWMDAGNDIHPKPKKERTAYVDLDEKWYFCVSLGKKLWMVPEQRKISKLKLINKGHIPKIMVIAAVGTPVTGAGHSLEDKSNGKVGIWRVMQNKKRSKSGWGPGRKKYYHAGDHQEVDCTLKGRGFQKTFIDKIYPEIKKKYAGYKEVIVQMDNATPHTKAIEDINQKLRQLKRNVHHGVVARRYGIGDRIPDVTLCLQPPNSPDMNMLDLAMFSATASALVKKRRTTGQLFDKDRLERDCKSVFADYPAPRLRAMWNTKAEVLKKIVYSNGGNDYELHGPAQVPHKKGYQVWNFEHLPEETV